MVRKTSLDAYKAYYASGMASHVRYKIYNFILNNKGVSRQDIARLLNIPINVVCGRAKELLDARAIKEVGRRENQYLLGVVEVAKWNLQTKIIFTSRAGW